MNSLKSIVDEMVSTKSEPTEGADKIVADSLRQFGIVDESKPTENTKAPESVANLVDGVTEKLTDYPAGTRLDSDGNPFDPDVHATDKDGNPKLTKNGRFRKRTGRRPTNSDTKTSADTVAARQAGKATAEVIFTSCVVIFGEEWLPIIDAETGVNERAAMIDAWAAYYEATGVKEIPPWVGLAITMSAYSLPRFAMPQTQSKSKKLMSYFKGLFGGKK